MPMKKRFRLIHRGERGGHFYCVDSVTGKRFSLRTKNRDVAQQVALAKNQFLRQPILNLQIAKAYLAGSAPRFAPFSPKLSGVQWSLFGVTPSIRACSTAQSSAVAQGRMPGAPSESMPRA